MKAFKEKFHITDNTPSSPNKNELNSGEIGVFFLSPNVISLCQTVDQSAIDVLKKKYRRRLRQSLMCEKG
jgi:hypothetical protein